MTEDKSKLFAKIATVMGQVRTLAKDGTNTYDKYQYVTADSAFERLGAAMANCNIVALPSIVELRTDEVMSQGGKPQTRSIIHGQITLADGETGATWTNDWWGEGIDRGDKSINKAVTAMMKYHLLRLFMVGTGEDADEDSPDITRKTSQKPQERTNGAQPSNRTAQHRNAPQRPSVRPTVQDEIDAISVAGSEPIGWDDLVDHADANRAEEAAASAPFVWPTSIDALELCAGTVNSPDLGARCHKMIQYFVGLNEGSRNGMTDKQYQFLSGLLDKRYNGGHNAILSALIGGVVDGEHVPGFDVKELIDWLKDEKANAQKLAILDELVSFVMADIAQFEVA